MWREEGGREGERRGGREEGERVKERQDDKERAEKRRKRKGRGVRGLTIFLGYPVVSECELGQLHHQIVGECCKPCCPGDQQNMHNQHSCTHENDCFSV